MGRIRFGLSRALAVAALSPSFLAAAACRTIEGQYVGEPRHGQCMRGVPIVVERSRWLKVTYTRVLYGTRVTVKENPRAVDGKQVRDVVTMVVPEESATIEITTQVVPVGEVYTVDFKRPASGTINYAMEWEPGRQFPKSLHTDVNDQTLSDVADSVTALKDLQKAIEEHEKQKRGKQIGTDALPGESGRVRITESIDRVEYYDLRTGQRVPWVKSGAR